LQFPAKGTKENYPSDSSQRVGTLSSANISLLL